MDNRKIDKEFVISIAIPLIVGLISGLLSMGGMKEFNSLTKPFLAPPGFIFPIVWTILYVLMGISAIFVLLYDISRLVSITNFLDEIPNFIISISFYLSLYIYIKLLETKDIKLKMMNFLPAIINFCFLIILFIIYFINKSNLSITNSELSSIYNYGIYAYSFAGYFMIAHIVYNIYLLTLFPKKKLKKIEKQEIK